MGVLHALPPGRQLGAARRSARLRRSAAPKGGLHAGRGLSNRNLLGQIVHRVIGAELPRLEGPTVRVGDARRSARLRRSGGTARLHRSGGSGLRRSGGTAVVHRSGRHHSLAQRVVASEQLLGDIEAVSAVDPHKRECEDIHGERRGALARDGEQHVEETGHPLHQPLPTNIPDVPTALVGGEKVGVGDLALVDEPVDGVEQQGRHMPDGAKLLQVVVELLATAVGRIVAGGVVLPRKCAALRVELETGVQHPPLLVRVPEVQRSHDGVGRPDRKRQRQMQRAHQGETERVDGCLHGSQGGREASVYTIINLYINYNIFQFFFQFFYEWTTSSLVRGT